ncbi:MAG: hypothetical protein C0606_13835 [Hyphomicrobiales bacterium]|nr:MAG: hypothetical protein C0606_13835 [Hyphomicrobiales bacterium]
MAASDYVYSVRGIVRGYQLFPDKGPLKLFFLTVPGDPEVPVRLTGVDLEMRDGHDVEVFYLHEAKKDKDLPLLVNNYSSQEVEEVREKDNRPPKKSRGCLAGGGAFTIAAIVLGAFFWPLLIGLAVWYTYKRVPLEKKFANKNRLQRNRQMLEAYIKNRYGRLITADDMIRDADRVRVADMDLGRD